MNRCTEKITLYNKVISKKNTKFQLLGDCFVKSILILPLRSKFIFVTVVRRDLYFDFFDIFLAFAIQNITDNKVINYQSVNKPGWYKKSGSQLFSIISEWHAYLQCRVCKYHRFFLLK